MDPITRLNAALEGRYRIERELGAPRSMALRRSSSETSCSARAPARVCRQPCEPNSHILARLDNGYYLVDEHADAFNTPAAVSYGVIAVTEGPFYAGGRIGDA